MKNKIIITIALTLILVLFFSYNPNEVIKVYDGDTIGLRSGEIVRLARIDSPEKKECGYKMSKKFLKDLLKNKTIELERKGQGKYNRTVSEVYINDNNVSNRMLKLGLAFKYNKPSTLKNVERKEKGIFKYCSY